MDVKGSTVDVKGSTVDVKGSAVDVKGSTVDVKGSTRTLIARKQFRGKSNSSVVKRLIVKASTDSFHLRRFSDVHEEMGGELNSSVVEWLNKGLMSALSPGCVYH